MNRTATKDVMALLTKFGSLVGLIPGAIGRVFWVSPAASFYLNGDSYEASDNNTGLMPQFALRSVQAAINLATASAGDVIALLPGTHTSAAQVTINKAGLTFIGVNPHMRDIEHYRPYAASTQVNWTSTLAGTAVALTVADCVFTGINMIPVTARTFMTGTTCPRTSFVDCAITLSAAASTSTKGIVFSGGSSAYISFVNCFIINTIATSAQGPAIDLTGASSFNVESCQVLLTGTSSAWAVAIQLGAGSSGIFRKNFIAAQGAGAITIGVDGTGVAVANAVAAIENQCGVSPAITNLFKNFTSTDNILLDNRIATISAGSGGTVITAST